MTAARLHRRFALGVARREGSLATLAVELPPDVAAEPPAAPHEVPGEHEELLAFNASSAASARRRLAQAAPQGALTKSFTDDEDESTEEAMAAQGLAYDIFAPMAEQLERLGGCVSVAVDTTPELVHQSPWLGDAEALAEYLLSLYSYASHVLHRDAGVALGVAHIRINADEGASPYTGSCTSLGPAGAMELLEEVVPVLEARQAADPSLPRAHLAQLVTGRLPDGRNCGGRATTYVGTLTPPKELSPINAVCQPKRRSVVSITSSWAGLPGLHDAPIVEARDASSDVQLFSAATWWDPLAVLHELGHNLGSGHTHDCTFYDPPLDQCGADEAAGCGARTCGQGTAMSYCHLCGLNSVRFELNPRVAAVIRGALAPAGVGCGTCAAPLGVALAPMASASDESTDSDIDAFIDAFNDSVLAAAAPGPQPGDLS